MHNCGACDTWQTGRKYLTEWTDSVPKYRNFFGSSLEKNASTKIAKTM